MLEARCYLRALAAARLGEHSVAAKAEWDYMLVRERFFGTVTVNATPDRFVSRACHLREIGMAKTADDECNNEEVARRLEAGLRRALLSPAAPHRAPDKNTNQAKPKRRPRKTTAAGKS